MSPALMASFACSMYQSDSLRPLKRMLSTAPSWAKLSIAALATR